MSDWTAADLDRIGSADEPVITTRWAGGRRAAPVRADLGGTYRR
jgi:hypothetical protein